MEVQKIKYLLELLDWDNLDAEKLEDFINELKKQENGDDVQYENEESK